MPGSVESEEDVVEGAAVTIGSDSDGTVFDEGEGLCEEGPGVGLLF